MEEISYEKYCRILWIQSRGFRRLSSRSDFTRKELAKRQITLIYGGASVGIMATVANTVLEEGGKVIGVIPTLLEEREIAHQQLTELIVVKTMHERKSKMMELADGFIVLVDLEH